MTSEEALVAHIKKDNSKFSDWYCGITNDVDKRIQAHRKEYNLKLPYYVKCNSKDSAMALEKRMHAKGCTGDGGIGNPVWDSNCVYVFKK